MSFAADLVHGQAPALESFGDRSLRPVEAPAPNDGEDQFNRPVRSSTLGAMWRIIGRNPLLTAILLLVLAAGPASIWLAKPVYSARATIQIDPPASRLGIAQNISADARRTGNDRLVQAQLDLLASRSTAQKVAERLNLANNPQFLREAGLDDEPAGPTRNAKVTDALQDRLSLSSSQDSRIVAVGFDSRDPVLASRTANAFADTFAGDSLGRRLVNHDLSRRFLRGQLEGTKARLARSGSNLVNYARNEGLVVADLEAAGLAGKAGLAELNAAYARDLASRLRALQRWQEFVSTPAIGNPVSVVDRAQPPAAPAYPRPAMNMALAALLGALVLGADIARSRINTKVDLPGAVERDPDARLPADPLPFAAHSAPGPIDDKVHGPDDLEGGEDAQLLGVVPLPRDGEDCALALADPLSPAAASHRAIFQALDRTVRADDHRVLLLTSSGPNEGKSTVALTLSANFAASGRNVLLIDTDMRRAAPHRMTGLSNQPGLADLLAGGSTHALTSVAQHCADRGFSVVSRGRLATNPTELLAGRRFADLLDEAATLYDVVIIDGPPVLGLADAPRLGGMADATVFVLQADRTSREHARLAMRRLTEAGAGQLRLVMTKFESARDVGASGHACRYGHAADEQEAFVRAEPPCVSRAPVHLTIDNMDSQRAGQMAQHQGGTSHGR